MKKQSSLMLILVVALLALLPLLAALQYHWLGEVSKGEQERMKANLKASAAQFARDFDNEIRTAFLHFHARIKRTPDLKDDLGENVLPEQYQSWQAVAPHPKLVDSIYQTRIDKHGEQGGYDLQKFNASTNRLEPVEWPDDLAGIRDSLELHRRARTSAQAVFENLLKHNVGPGVDKAGAPAIFRFSQGPIDPRLPGLIINIFAPSNESTGHSFDLPVPTAYRIVVFNRDYIQNQLIPELSQRYFSSGGKSDYNVAVVDADDSSRIVFKSNPELKSSDLGKGDVSESFFTIRINEPDRIFIAEAKSGNKQNAEEKVTSDRKQVAISIFQRNETFAAGTNAPVGGETGRVFAKMSNEGYWRLIAKHRAGSLEAAVAGARRRNLAISFGILLLLGLSMGLIVLSSRRAQKLATQQMEFVAGVSHELRTPLAVICSAGENLADGVIDNRDQIKRYGGLIRDEGRRLTGMVEQVLEFAGAQSGRQSYQFHPVRVEDVIEAAVSACRPQLDEGGFELNRNIPADLPVIDLDAGALSRAIQNLINNAIKYSGESRWLEIGAQAVKSRQTEEIQIRVSDHGIGIAPSELSHIFEPFYRCKEAAAAQIHGNGLGLSLVKHIVEAHGGRVGVKSELRKGTTFILHLPVTHTTAAPEREEKSYEQTHFAR